MLYEKNHTVCRLPLLFGSYCQRQIVGKLIQKLQSNEDIYVADDIYSTPINTEDVADFVAHWVMNKEYYLGEIVHLTSDRLINLADIVKLAKQRLHLKGKIRSVKNDYFKSFEKKPKNGGLDSKKLATVSFESSIEKYFLNLI